MWRVRGLSPPTRGNLKPSGIQIPCWRSIPAHAGEPRTGATDGAREEVYPRPRGGTVLIGGATALVGGLSPPTRGNRSIKPPARMKLWSIPAHAGEPELANLQLLCGGVYPRPRGGTFGGDGRGDEELGLSPPTRGNLSHTLRNHGEQRSIPAHAGEPEPNLPQLTATGVYPRPRGGTSNTCARVNFSRGLSPPTRGNLGSRPSPCSRIRSIPAHAGEPCIASSVSGAPRVYPRPRGGTR